MLCFFFSYFILALIFFVFLFFCIFFFLATLGKKNKLRRPKKIREALKKKQGVFFVLQLVL